MIRPECASQINPYATSTSSTKASPEVIPTSAVSAAPVVEDELSLKIDKMLEELVFTLVKDARDDASRRKAIAELHKLRDRKHRRAMDLEKLKIHQRRMDLQESEHQRRREELEFKKQQADARQPKSRETSLKPDWKARAEAVLQAAMAVKDIVAHKTAASATSAPETSVKAPAASEIKAAIQAPAAAPKTEAEKTEAAKIQMNAPSPAPVTPPQAAGNEKQRRRDRMRARKLAKKANRELKKQEQMAARSALSGTPPVEAANGQRP